MLRLSITLLTVLYLALAAQSALSYLFTSETRESSEVVLEVSEKDNSNRSLHHDLSMTALIADGRLLRWGLTDFSAGWALDGSTSTNALACRTNFRPALLTFHAKHFVALLRSSGWGGVIRVKRNGKQVRVMEIQPIDGSQSQIAVEDPAGPPSPRLFAGALLLFAGCAWWFGPVRARRRSIPWLVFSLAILHLLFWASQPIGTNSDSDGYLHSFSIFIAGHPSYFPPGYPALLGAVTSVAGQSLGAWITGIQHGMVVVEAIWLYALLRRFVVEELALLASLLAGALIPSLTVPQALISETSASFAMLGALYYAVRSKETERSGLAVVAGLLAGWAVTTRIAPVAALCPAFCIVYLSDAVRKNRRLLGIALAATAVFTLLPVAWFWRPPRGPRLTDSTGFHLFNRVVTEQKLVNEGAPATRKLLALLGDNDPRAFRHWDLRTLSGVRELTYSESEVLLRNVSMEGIYKNPWGFLSYTLQLTWRLLAVPTGGIPVWADTINAVPRFENPRPLAVTASSLEWRWSDERLYDRLWPALVWFAIAGIPLGMMGRQRSFVLALSWIPVGYLLATACVEMFSSRYNAPIVPFVVGLAMFPFDLVSRRLPVRSKMFHH